MNSVVVKASLIDSIQGLVTQTGMIISPVVFPHSIIPFGRPVRLPQDYVFYQRGTMALVAALMAILKQRQGNKRVHVVFPDYFCGEPLLILERFPIDVSFYPIQKNLEPDWTQVKEIFHTSQPDAFVLVHYFGFPNNIVIAKQLCDESGVELIEDCTHVLHPLGAIGTSGSFAIFSPWKLLPLPELGVLSAVSKFAPFIELYSPVYRPVTLVKWYIKREIQRFLSGVGINWYRRAITQMTVVEEHSMSPDIFSMYLFRRHANMLEWVRSRRVQNYRAVEFFLKEGFTENIFFQELPGDVTPYCFPYVTKKPAEVLSRVLIQRGIPAYLWPTLPLKIQKERTSHPEAHWLAEHMLLLPIHQNVSARQIDYMKLVLSER